MITFKQFLQEDGESIPVNNVGGGNVAGLGQGVQGEPGVDLKKYKKTHKTKIILNPIAKRKLV